VRADPFEDRTRLPLAAQRLFTDREDLIRVFRAAVAASAGRSLSALVFYGVGGVGKTSLLHRLREELAEALPHAFVDLGNLGDRTYAYREVLVKLRSDLGTRFNIDFPRFDLCLAVLLAREGDEPPPLIRMNPRVAGTFKLVLDLLQVVPGVGAGALVLSTATKWAANFPGFQDFIRKAGGMEEVLELRRRAAQDDGTLDAELITRFARDLGDGLPPAPGRACRGVLFFDTYEALWAARDAAAVQSRELQWWVRDLVRYCLHPRMGVLPVIAARDRLTWEDDEPAWREVLEQHLVGGLSADDAQTFLSRCGIGRSAGEPATPLQQAIIRCCNSEYASEVSCHPLFLALCAEIAINTRTATGAEPPPQLFVGIPQPQLGHELARRFLTSLHSAGMQAWVVDLSLTPRFDDEAALALAQARRHAVGLAEWKRLREFSFLEPLADGFYRLHATMRTALQAHIDDDDTPVVHRWFAGYWEEHGQPILAWYSRWTLGPTIALYRWEKEHSAALEQRRIADARRLLAKWSEIALDDADRRRMGDGLWARTHLALGSALSGTPAPAMGDALNAAIAHFNACLLVYTERGSPQMWATVQGELGTAYANLWVGDRGANVARAIVHYEAALRVRTETETPLAWAATQNNLGIAYAELPAGDRGENLRRAVACYEAALRVYTESARPKDWALVQHNLGTVYARLPAGDRDDHLAKAVACLEASLRVRTEADDPRRWAMTQSDLGNVYAALQTGDRDANLRRAIACYEAALRILTEDDFPHNWVIAQVNLAIAHRDLSSGDRAANLSRAIAHLEAAERVYTEAHLPRQWVKLQVELGEAYADLPRGDPQENVRRAIAHYEAALRVYTDVAFPAERAEVQEKLAGLRLRLEPGHADE
jgi:tetratricopeptide (TPR) repeat protein